MKACKGSRRAGQISGFLILMIVLAMAALVCAYVFYSISDERRSNLEATQKAIRESDQRLGEAQSNIQKWQQVVGVEDVAEVVRKVEEFDPELVGTRRNLAGLIHTLEEMRDESLRRQQIAEHNLVKAKKALDGVTAEYEANQKAKQEELNAFRKRLAAAESELKKVKQEYNSKTGTLKSEGKNAQRKISQLKEELEEEQRRHVLEVQRLKIELGTKLEEIRSKMREFMVEADGKILFVEPALNTVTINIGRKDGVKAGMVFKVYRLDETGERVEKGRIRVRRADAGVSICEIVDTAKAQALVPSDLIDSPLFPEGHNFCVIGIYPRKEGYDHARWEIVDIIKSFGGNIVDKVDLTTDYVIQGIVEHYEAFNLSDYIDTRGREFDELPKWDVERQLGRRLEDLNAEELRDIMDGDVERRNNALEFRVPVLTADEFMQYVAR